MNAQKHQTISRGFTLVEMAIIIPIMIIAAIVMFDILWSMLGSSSIDRERLNMIYDKQSAMAIIESDVSLVSRYHANLDAGLTDPYLPTSNGGTWSYRGDSASGRYLILRAYSTTNNPLSSDRSPVFVGSGTACSAGSIYFNTVQRYDIIYFVKNNNLYRRRVVDASTPTCSTQYQKLSCPSAADLGTTQNAACKADDELILDNVNTFSVNYYASKTSTTPLDVYASGASSSLVTSATDIEVTLGTSIKVSGKTITSQSKLRMSKLNQDL